MRHLSSAQKEKIKSIVTNLIVLFTLSSIFVTIASFWSQPNFITILVNSDVAQDLYIAHNLIYEHGSLLNWHVSAAPYYFPDLTFFYISEHFIKNLSANFPLFALFQIGVLFSVIVWLFWLTTRSKIGMRIGILSVLFYLFMICVRHQFILYHDADAFITVLFPSFHYSGALIVFLCLALFLQILKKPKFHNLMLLALFLILGGFSDSFITMYFTIPTLATLTLLISLRYINIKTYIQLTLFLTSTIIVTYLIYRYSPFPIERQRITMAFRWIHLLNVLKTIFNIYLKHHTLFAIMWIVFMTFAPISLLLDHRKRKQSRSLFNYAILFLWMMPITAIPILSMLLPASWGGNLHNIWSLQVRYMIAPLLGPSLIGFPLLIYKHYSSLQFLTQSALFPIILLIASIVVLWIRPTLNKSNLFNYYPELAACVDSNAKKFHLHNGIGTHFMTDVITQFSRQGVHMTAARLTQNNISPRYWISAASITLYPQYDFFMLTNSQDIQTIIRLYGKPDHRFQCGQYIHDYQAMFAPKPNKFTFLVYHKGQLKKIFNKFSHIK